MAKKAPDRTHTTASLTHWGRDKMATILHDIFKCIFLNENIWISTGISLIFVPTGPICNIPALIQIMAWRLSGDKPLPEPMTVILLTHICITRPQWVSCGNCIRLSHVSTYFPKNASYWPNFGVIFTWLNCSRMFGMNGLRFVGMVYHESLLNWSVCSRSVGSGCPESNMWYLAS